MLRGEAFVSGKGYKQHKDDWAKKGKKDSERGRGVWEVRQEKKRSVKRSNIAGELEMRKSEYRRKEGGGRGIISNQLTLNLNVSISCILLEISSHLFIRSSTPLRSSKRLWQFSINYMQISDYISIHLLVFNDTKANNRDETSSRYSMLD